MKGLGGGFYEIKAQPQGDLVLSTGSKTLDIFVGDRAEKSLVLAPGIIFRLGEDLFAVHETTQGESPQKTSKSFKALKEALIKMPDTPLSKSKDQIQSQGQSQLLKTPLKFDFVRGFWINQSWIMEHCPVYMGCSSLIYFFPDESIETKKNFLNLELKGTPLSPHFSTPFKDLVYINHSPVTCQKICDGDFIEFGKTAFYVRFYEQD